MRSGVAAVRTWLGLTQAEFASISGVTRSTVARWEGGHKVPGWLDVAVEQGSWRGSSEAAGHQAGEALRDALYAWERLGRARAGSCPSPLYDLLRALLEGRLGRRSVAPKPSR